MGIESHRNVIMKYCPIPTNAVMKHIYGKSHLTGVEILYEVYGVTQFDWNNVATNFWLRAGVSEMMGDMLKKTRICIPTTNTMTLYIITNTTTYLELYSNSATSWLVMVDSR
jgi:hypothetical protein